MTPLIGQDIGRYHIIEQLGEGGMAQVFKAYDNRLERYVAVKVILPSQEQSDLFLKRFEREAKSLAQLSHSNIVRVLDFGDQNGMPYLIMEYVSGGTLKQRMGRRYPYAEAAQMLLPIANALQYAHQHGIFHRDVKPANILISDGGQPLLSDFGIAKVLENKDQATLTGTGVGIGTPEYMAPEQGLGQMVDQRADIYSLGVIFYEMVTGRKPFRADTPMAVVLKQVSEPLPRPREFVSELPETVEAVIFRALAKKPEDRYPDMQVFAAALERLSQKNLTPAVEATMVGSTGAETIMTPRPTQAVLGATQVAPGGSTNPGVRPAQPAPVRKKGISPIVWIGVAAVAIVAVILIVAVAALGVGAKKAGLFGAINTPTVTAVTHATQVSGSDKLETLEPAAQATAEMGATPGTEEPVVQPTEAAPEQQAGKLSVPDISAGLTELSSYRMLFNLVKDDNGEKISSKVIEEVDNTKHLKHLRSEGNGGSTSGIFEFYVVGDTTYSNDEAGGTCESAGTGQEGLIDATVLLPGSVIGKVENAALVEKGSTANKIAADRYAIDQTSLPDGNLSEAKGDLFFSPDGKYVVKLLMEGTNPSGVEKWEYSISDVNQPIQIALPAKCTASSTGGLDITLPKNATNISQIAGMTTFKSPDTSDVIANFFKITLPQKGWTATFQTGSGPMNVLIFTKDEVTIQVMIQTQGDVTSVTINQQK